MAINSGNITAQQLNEFAGFLSYKPTWVFKKFIRMPFKVIGLFTGNQFGKTSMTAYQYVLRILGRHPVPKKNVVYFECSTRNNENLAPHGYYSIKEPGGIIVPGWEKGTWTIRTVPKDFVCPYCGAEIIVHQRGSRIFRFASENLPGETVQEKDKGEKSTEVKNAVYPEFKKWLPPFLIKRDIKFRNMSMVILDPLSGMEFGGKKYIGEDIVIEFVSYSQTVQSGAGVQRLSIWEDEEARKDFHNEQLPRLLAEDGDLIITLTPANKTTWTYDEIFEKARVYYRSSAICDFLRSEGGEVKQIEATQSPYPIGVLQAATDDNPTLSPEVIEEMFQGYDDPDDVATRRFGLHRQHQGRIFKSFDYGIHFISATKYFPNGIPHDWLHARGIDYHPRVPWACGAMSLSPYDEAFIWCDYNPSPEKLTTEEICTHLAQMFYGYKFVVSLIDPEAEVVKKDKKSVLDDINRIFWAFRKNGEDYGGAWETWNTKGDFGRREIQKRLKNAAQVGKPFNNEVVRDGRKVRLPTLWILDTCKTSADFMRKWRWDEWADNRAALTTKDLKDTPQQKWSHFNMIWEAIFKEPRFRVRKGITFNHPTPRYFQGVQ